MKFVVSFIGLVLLCGCGSERPPKSANPHKQVRQGNRILGMDIKDIPSVNYDSAFKQAVALGVREVSLSLDWAAMEPQLAYYDDSLANIINAYYPQQLSDITLILRPLDTAGPRLPAELEGLAWDDPQMMTAFEQFLNHLHEQLPSLNASGKLKWIYVGNEIDAQLGDDSIKWAQWQTFFIAAKTKIESLWGPEIDVSSIIQFSALTQPERRSLYLKFLPNLDSAVLTYYPLHNDFTVKATSIIAADFSDMNQLIPEKMIVLQECGYPSSLVNNSSELQQAGFISAVFAAWDTHQERIKLIDFAWQYDVAEDVVDQWVIDYAMAGQPEQFKYYLWSLGLSHYDGSEKSALGRLREELQVRDWQ